MARPNAYVTKLPDKSKHRKAMKAALRANRRKLKRMERAKR